MAFPSTPILDDFDPDDATPMAGYDSPLLGSVSASGGVGVPGSAGYNVLTWATTGTGSMEAFITLATKGATGDEFAISAMLQQAGSLATIDGYDFYVTVSAGTDTWALRRLTNGASSNLTTGTQELSTNDQIGIRVDNGIISGWINGVMVGSAADTTYTGSGKIGYSPENTTWRMAGFGGGMMPKRLAALGVG